MATKISDIIPMMNRELNAPGTEQYPDLLGGDYLGYIADGFWDARLAGMLYTYTIVDGADLATPLATGDDYITDQASKVDDLPEEFQFMVVIFAGTRLLRNKILTLAVNYKATAGPVDYEQQASATTLRAILSSLERRVNELQVMYSDEFTPGVFAYMDGVLQRAESEMQGYLALTVL
jgi:hypothetical protein